MNKAELEAELSILYSSAYLKNVQTPAINSSVVRGLVTLTRTVMKLDEDVEKLDRTSAFLAWVNISVGIVVAVIGGFQVYLMLKGH